MVAAAAAAVSAALTLALLAPAASAAPGDVDRGFGAHGSVSVLADAPLDRTGFYVTGEDMAIGPRDEIYTLLSTLTCQPTACQARLVVERFLADGTVDPSFGVNGVSPGVPIPQPGINRSPYVLALAADGRPVIAFPSNGNIVLVRFDAAGRLDPSFGVGGMVIADFGGAEAEPELAVQPDGGIVLAADSESAAGRAVALARYRVDGSLDPSFGGAGVTVLRASALGGLAALSGGQLALGVPGCCALTAKAVRLGRLSAGGVLDRGLSLSSWGRLRVGPATTLSELIALPGGKLMLVGVSEETAFAARLRANGRPDRGFGRGGTVRMGSIPVRSPEPRAAVDARGRLVMVGSKNLEEPFSNDVSILRRLPDGRRDRSFGGGRPVPLGHYLSGPLALGMQSGRRPVLFAESGACVRTCYSRAPLLIRFLGGSSKARCAGRRATIVGTREKDVLVGTPGRDVIAALAGNDTVRGRGGGDLICGGAGRDELSGGAGLDRLHQ